MPEVAEAPAEATEEPVVLKDVGVFNVNGHNGISSNKGMEALLIHVKPEDRPKALILTVDTGGSPHEAVIPTIQKLTNEGIPVFMVQSHYDTGPWAEKDTMYEPERDAIQAGATPLVNVDLRDTVKLAGRIQTSINEGKTGPDLVADIKAQFPAAPPPPGPKT